MGYADPINRVVEQLVKIPTIGEKTAERITLHLLKMPSAEIHDLCQALTNLKNTHSCKLCFNLTGENGLCRICNDHSRDFSTICVVEQPSDLRALEQTGVYRGLYHILGGHLAPLEGIESKNLTIQPLFARLREGKIKEIILATNPTLEGDATALYLQSLLEEFQIKISRLAKGLTSGSTIESASKVVLTDALKDRKTVEQTPRRTDA